MSRVRIGLALGGGSARGLAHIPMLEVFDELGLKPSAIAGCSIGALIGAGYAAGMSAAEIRERAEKLLRESVSWLEVIAEGPDYTAVATAEQALAGIDRENTG